jgi:PAS domain S-box-containing protein
MRVNTTDPTYDFERALNLIPGLVWSSLPDGFIDFLNDRWLEYTGLALGDAQGWGWAAAIHPDDLPALFAYWKELLAGASPGETEARLRRFDGTFRWFLFRAVPLLNERGQPLKWYGQTTDIDDRKRAETILSAQKALLEKIATGGPLRAVMEALCRHLEELVDSSLASVLLLDRHKHRIRHGASPSLPASFAELVDGLTVEAERGPCTAAIIARAPVARQFSALEPVPPHMKEMVEVYGVTSSVSIPFFSSQGEPLGALALYGSRGADTSEWRLNALTQFASMATIAVERERTFAAITRNERYLAEAQRLSHTGSFSWSPRTTELVWSDELYRIYGLDPAEPLTLDRAHAQVHPEDVEMVSAIEQRLASNREASSFSHRIVRPDGTVRSLEVIMRPMPMEHGDESWEYFGAVHDVTERKTSEARLNQVQDELAHVTRAATLGELTASIAHEVNQPLTGILLNANTCARWLATSVPNVGEAADAAQRIVRDSKRAVEVIARLRALFGKTEGPKAPVDVNEAIEEVLTLTRSELQKQRVGLRRDFDPALPLALGHRVQVQQVAMNLIVNAREALQTVEARPRVIVVSTSWSGAELQVRIQDNGLGISAQAADQVFEAFYTSKSGGMGMGLAVSRTIVQNHGGRLWFEPNEDFGVTFAFSLAVHPDSLPAIEASKLR